MPPRCAVRVAAALLLGALSGAAVRAETANRIVATIDGEPITAYELRRFARDRGLEQAPPAQVLEALVTDKLLEMEIKSLGIAARDEEIDRYIKEIQARNGMDDERFKAALAAQGVSYDVYRARVKTEIEKAQLVNREIRGRVSVTPEEVQRYYEAHQGEYATADKVKVRHIMLLVPPGAEEAEVAQVRAKAEEVRALAQKGRDFEDLAKEFSEGPGAEQGGELGTFSKGEMDRALDEAVFALKPGQVSEPVRSPAGFHLLVVEERTSAGNRPIGEVKHSIRETLYNQLLEERFQNWLSRDLRERHHVEVLN